MDRITRVARKVFFATDRSLAFALREDMIKAVMSTLPSGYFYEDKLHDTQESGKGYRGGYVSFGLKPSVFDQKGIIGGILIGGTYDTKVIRSTSPEPGTPEWDVWAREEGNLESAGVSGLMTMTATYYHKRPGGGGRNTSLERDIGDAEFSLDELENVHFFELSDPSTVSSVIMGLVEEVLNDPPEGAASQNKAVQKRISPYSSKKKFLDRLLDDNRNSFNTKEVMAINQWTGENPQKIIKWFKDRGFSYQQVTL